MPRTTRKKYTQRSNRGRVSRGGIKNSTQEENPRNLTHSRRTNRSSSEDSATPESAAAALSSGNSRYSLRNQQHLKRPLGALKDSTNNSSLGKKKRTESSLINPTKSTKNSNNVVDLDPRTNEGKRSTSMHASAAAITPTSTSAKQKKHDNLFLSDIPSKKLPLGVINLYDDTNNHRDCQCREDDCSADSLMHSYLREYGWDYNESMRVLESRLPNFSLDEDDVNTFATDHADYMVRQPELTSQMRLILVNWIFELSEEYDLSPDTVHLAITLIDQSLSCGPHEDDSDDDDESANSLVIVRDMLQCLGCACTWIACKMEEVKPPSVRDFVYISDNIYTSDQIREMELKVCTALNFHLWHATPVHFAHEFLRASHGCSNQSCCQRIPPILHNLVLYLLEVSRLPYELASKQPRLLAAAAVYLARATLRMPIGKDDDGYWNATLQHYTRYDKMDLKETALAIHECQLEMEESEHQSAYIKYKSPKYCRVSLRTCPNVEDLMF